MRYVAMLVMILIEDLEDDGGRVDWLLFQICKHLQRGMHTAGRAVHRADGAGSGLNRTDTRDTYNVITV